MDIHAYIAPLRKWWWLIAAAAIVAALGSFLSVRNQPDMYRSQATLLVGSTIEDPNPSGGQLSAVEQLAANYADIAQRQPVREAVMEELGLSSLPGYAVTPLPRTQLMIITVNDTSPERAQAVANALAQQLVQLSPSGSSPEEAQREAFINTQLDDLQIQIEETDAEIEARQQELGALFSAQEINETQAEIAALQAKRNTLQNNFASLLANTSRGALNRITIIEPANLPRSPVDPRHELTILIAAVVGMILAGGAAYGLEFLDDTIRSPEDAERYARDATTVTIANIAFDEDESRLITHAQPRSPHAEAFRILRTAIHYARKEERQRLLLITSPRAGDGKSLIAANLAVVLAQSGLRVLLVDGDLRRSVQHDIFKQNNDVGLSDLLLGDRELESNGQRGTELERPTGIENLWLMTSGDCPANPSELLGSPVMRLILSTLEQRFDYVIIDSPPCLAVTDPVVLSTQVDAVFVVVKAGSTRRKELQETIKRLNSVGNKVRGIILNHSKQVDAHYYYVESYYHHHEQKPGRAKWLTSYFNGGSEKVPDAEPDQSADGD
ncbi:MAG TPA: polysaccharide biosynthesis tyrosine autokinase [Candidatus Sulfomarinibacteraceae bacterium]|nr:polysaccharide biosynthesis tyrosine autokinase [Candidatus Sulfomarinibacteraceae bacterium]